MPEFEIDGVFTQTFPIKKYNFLVCNIQLHTSITLVIRLMDTDNRTVHTIQREIEGDEYDKWGFDDSYLDKIAEAEVNKVLNLVPLEEIPLEEFEILAEESVVAGEPVKPVRKTRAKKTA
jgi:hypothetical protein